MYEIQSPGWRVMVAESGMYATSERGLYVIWWAMGHQWVTEQPVWTNNTNIVQQTAIESTIKQLVLSLLQLSNNINDRAATLHHLKRTTCAHSDSESSDFIALFKRILQACSQQSARWNAHRTWTHQLHLEWSPSCIARWGSVECSES